MTDDDQRVRTLGERLDEAGRRLSVRHLPAYPWAGGLGRVLARARSLTGQFDGRFERVEWPPDGRDLTASATRWAARRGAAGTAPGPAGVPGLPVAADGARAGEGRPLPADVRARLRARVGPGADALRVHDDGAAATGPARTVDSRCWRTRPPTSWRCCTPRSRGVGRRTAGSRTRSAARWRRSAPSGAASSPTVARARGRRPPRRRAARRPGRRRPPAPWRPRWTATRRRRRRRPRWTCKACGAA